MFFFFVGENMTFMQCQVLLFVTVILKLLKAFNDVECYNVTGNSTSWNVTETNWWLNVTNSTVWCINVTNTRCFYMFFALTILKFQN